MDGWLLASPYGSYGSLAVPYHEASGSYGRRAVNLWPSTIMAGCAALWRNVRELILCSVFKVIGFGSSESAFNIHCLFSVILIALLWWDYSQGGSKYGSDFDQGKKVIKMSREFPYKEIHMIF